MTRDASLCVFGHIDVLPPVPHSIPTCELLLTGYVSADSDVPGRIDVVALKQTRFRSHFELVRRFHSDDEYFEELASEKYRALRAALPTLGSPYEDRVFSIADGQWPDAGVGDHVVITQLELRPGHDGGHRRAVQALLDAEERADQFAGGVLLQRAVRGSNFELLSAWSSPEAFMLHLESPQAAAARRSLIPFLVAPVEDRGHGVLCGKWGSCDRK